MLMAEHRDKRLQELRRRVMNGEYRVDPHALADAIIHRRWSVETALELAQVSSIASRRGRRAHVQRAGSAARRAGTEALAA
jgi:Anti-sigma-28 factor, FlgM